MSDAAGGGSRAGRGGRTKKGKPRPGTGGQGRRKLEGKGPTPPAHMRPGHPAQRRAEAAARAASRRGAGGRAGREEEPRTAGGDRTGPAGRRRYADTATAGRAAGEQAAAGRARGAWEQAGTGRARGAWEQAGTGRARGAAEQAGTGRARGAGDAPEVVAGRNAVVEALRARVPANALFAGPRWDADDRVREAIDLAAAAGIPLIEAGRAELDRLTGGALHQGLALRIKPYEYAHPDDLPARAAARGEPPLIVALDGITDPRNLGAIARSAAAFGGHGLLVAARRSAPVTAGAWKSSAGALARVPVAQAPNLARALAGYAAEGLFIAGLDTAGETGIGDLEIADGPLVLVVGSEGKGLSRLVAERCDVLARIAMADQAESLNAGVAAGIALHEVARRRAR